MSKKTRLGLAVFCLMFCFLAVTPYAHGITTTSKVEITKDGQVVSSILYNNILTQAIYTPKANVANYNTDTTYCCAALVKRFYANVFNVTVYGLFSTTSVPVVTQGGVYETTNPKAGDIVRFNNYTHWAIIKKIDTKGNITLLEQNVWSGNYALVDRVISADEVNNGAYTYYRYSKALNGNAHVHAYKEKYAETHPHQYYMGCNGCGDYYHLDKYASTIDCLECYLDKYGSLPVTSSGTPNPATVKINGKAISFDAYNINGNNYFKLRDLAYCLNSTSKKFAVDWDNELKAVNMKTGSSYKTNGSEMAAKGTSNVKASISNSNIYYNKIQIYPLTYLINNNNYVKLQDLAKALDVNVSYDNNSKVININTSKSY